MQPGGSSTQQGVTNRSGTHRAVGVERPVERNAGRQGCQGEQRGVGSGSHGSGAQGAGFSRALGQAGTRGVAAAGWRRGDALKRQVDAPAHHVR
eukprot:6360391-Prymnesium_polylepis.1